MYRKYIKRLLDILFSFVAIVLLLPIMIITACLIKLFIGSPIIFTQERPGKDEIIFKIHKFRTMTNKTDSAGVLLPDKERLIPIGKLLRKTSLDELPELWDIFIGKMSFIGPRPLLVSYLPYYTAEERVRHNVRPGLTGLAQIKGRNGLSWDERFQEDVRYVQSVTFCQDFRIFWATVFMMLKVGSGVSDDTSQTEGNLAKIRQMQTVSKE